MTEPSHAVFLSYASQDAQAAQRICEALRASGIEVWFDQSELRGGDAWDRQIRERIHDCRLFIALISARTEARDEGYFRHEWKLAVERTHHMSDEKPFLVPVVIDDTQERGASVPDKLHDVQWTRLPGGEVPREFVERIKRLLSPELPTTARLPEGAASGSSSIPLRTGWPSPLSRVPSVAVAVLFVVALAYLLINKPWISRPATPPTVSNASPGASPAGFSPPPHSIAVLPFVNMSGDKEQEYFSDGLAEELLNSLAEINELQVAARTSAFSFKGKDTDIGTIARKLNVGAVLEGSVRRSGNTVRVTTQLINAVTGFHLWSHSYDRDLGNVLKLQAEISDAVATALKVTLLGDVATRIEIGGTRVPAAFDAYLRAAKAASARHFKAAIDSYTDAIRLDSTYALAYAARSMSRDILADEFATTPSALRAGLNNAQADARQAIALAPDLSEAHLALAMVNTSLLEFRAASGEYQHAVALAPGNARILRHYGGFAIQMGHSESGLAALRRAVTLDPLNPAAHQSLGYGLLALRRYADGLAAFKDAEVLGLANYFAFGMAYYQLGDFERARASCEKDAEDPEDHDSWFCLSMTYDRLGRRADAEAALRKLRATVGDTTPYWYSEINAQWGNIAQALNWLEKAQQLRNGGLADLKTDFLVDPLRNEPRFQAVMRELKFPD